MFQRRKTAWAFLLLAIFLSSSIARAQSFNVVHLFDNSTENPQVPPLAASDGNLYLPTFGGGMGLGAIYRLTPDGSGGFSCAMIHEFSGSDGSNPRGGLVEGPDGLLYGTTFGGGASGWGVLYRISTGGVFETLRSLALDDAANPFGELVVAGDGKLYGTSSEGGGGGSVFGYDPGNGEFEILYFFAGLTGADPQSGLLLGSDGKLYGSTPNGGSDSNGTLFRIATNGDFELLYSLTSTDALRVTGVLAELGGVFYGSGHDNADAGAIFRWSEADGFDEIHTFTGADGAGPEGGLLAYNGSLYGVTAYGGAAPFAGTVFASDASGGVTTLHAFIQTDGAQPSAHPIRVGSGWVGTTMNGGPGFSGTVYRIADGGDFSTLCAFGQGDGSNAAGALVQASDGDLYGTTLNGGLYSEGTIFRLTPEGDASPLHSFDVLDGRYPRGGLVQGSDGALFGTTFAGGGSGEGAAFRMDLSGTFSLLRSYSDDTTGYLPSFLTIGSDGEMYGPTGEGGACGAGVLYHLGTDGTVANLHDSCSGVVGPLASGSDGDLHGLEGASLFRLSTAGEYSSSPTVLPLNVQVGPLAEGPDHVFYAPGTDSLEAFLFRLRAGGRSQVLHTFAADPPSVRSATALLPGSDGRLYGASYTGTPDDPGTIFRISIYGDLEVLHTFDPSDPKSLWVPLEGSDGRIYGLAGSDNYGAPTLAYAIDLGTQVNQIAPSSGPAFDTADIHLVGAHFQDGATVAVGGTPATGVSVSSDTDASATVPVLFPGTLNDVVLTNPDASSGTLKNGWFADFLDVPQDDPIHAYVESVVRNHVAAGFGSGVYGRDDAVTRSQMAVYLVKGGVGPGTIPASCANGYIDVPCPSLYADWITELGKQQITSGCQTFPPAYCPDAPVTRAQMAVLLLKTVHGSNYTPPACQGIFGDVACPGGFAADWIEDLYNSGVTAGCSAAPLLYCPDGPVSRGQMAVFVVRAFGLP